MGVAKRLRLTGLRQRDWPVQCDERQSIPGLLRGWIYEAVTLAIYFVQLSVFGQLPILEYLFIGHYPGFDGDRAPRLFCRRTAA